MALLCQLAAMAQEQADTAAVNVEYLMNTDSLPSATGHLLDVPHSGLFYADDGTIYSLDRAKSPRIGKFRFKDRIPFEQMAVSDGKFLVKSYQYVLQIDSTQTRIVTEMDTQAFAIFAGSGGRYHVVAAEADSLFAWYQCNITTAEMECIVRQKEPIQLILDIGGTAFCITGKDIYYVTDTNMDKLLTADDIITSAIYTPQGLFYCTQNGLFLMDNEGNTATLSDDAYHSLYYDNGTVYLVMQNGAILKMDLR